MRFKGKGPNFLLIDLSKLDSSSAAVFLADLSKRSENGTLPLSRCHWIVAPLKGREILSTVDEGSDFLRNRLAGGDRLLCVNPTGLDWNCLFPLEAERERALLSDLIGQEAFLFLESTPLAPDWLAEMKIDVLRASSEGLWVKRGQRESCFSWAEQGGPRTGVWWIVPGQALVAALPPAPWADLLESPLKELPSQATPTNASVSPSPAAKLPLYRTGLSRRHPAPSSILSSVLVPSREYPGLGTKEAVDFDEALGGIRKRSLVANMQGQTDLEEDGLQVRFRGGRLESISDAKSGSPFCSGAESYLEWNGKRHSYQVNSAFSFEGDFSWGLRQSLVLEHEDLVESSRAILDFFFVEESPEFFISATIRWPRWRVPVMIDRWAILEMTVMDLPRSTPWTTRSVWPDGRSHNKIHRGDKFGVLSGTDFLFAGPSAMVLGFPQNQTARPHVLPWTLERRLATARLLVNPEGGFGPKPSQEFDGMEEHFSFYVSRAEGAKFPFTVSRKQAIELIPPYVLSASEVSER